MSRKLHILAIKTFARWMRKSKVSPDDLVLATEEMAKSYLELTSAETAAAIDEGKLIELHGEE